MKTKCETQLVCYSFSNWNDWVSCELPDILRKCNSWSLAGSQASHLNQMICFQIRTATQRRRQTFSCIFPLESNAKPLLRPTTAPVDSVFCFSFPILYFKAINFIESCWTHRQLQRYRGGDMVHHTECNRQTQKLNVIKIVCARGPNDSYMHSMAELKWTTTFLLTSSPPLAAARSLHAIKFRIRQSKMKHLPLLRS